MKRVTRSKQKASSAPATTRTTGKRPASASPTSPTVSPSSNKSKRCKAGTSSTSEAETKRTDNSLNIVEKVVKVTRSNSSRNGSPTLSSLPSGTAATKSKDASASTSPVLCRRSNRSTSSSPLVNENVASTPPSKKKLSTIKEKSLSHSSTSSASPDVSSSSMESRRSRKNNSRATVETTAVGGKQKRPRPASSEEDAASPNVNKQNSAGCKSRKTKRRRKRLQNPGDIATEEKLFGEEAVDGITDADNAEEKDENVASELKRTLRKGRRKDKEIKNSDKSISSNAIGSCPSPIIPTESVLAQVHDCDVQESNSVTFVNNAEEDNRNGSSVDVKDVQEEEFLGNNTKNIDHRDVPQLKIISKITSSKQSAKNTIVRENRHNRSKRRLSNGNASDSECSEEIQSKKLCSAVTNSNGINVDSAHLVNITLSNNSGCNNATEDNVIVKPVPNSLEEGLNGTLNGSVGHCDIEYDLPHKVCSQNETNCVLPKEAIDTVLSRKSPDHESMVNVDVVSDMELLLRKFGLDDTQLKEVISLLPLLLRGSVTVPAIQELVWAVLRDTRSLVATSTPRCNKLVRQLLDHYCHMDGPTVNEKHTLCQECVSWARAQHRTSLTHELEVSLMALYASTGHWRLAEQTATTLYNTTKKMQDKEKTVKACLCLSRCYHALGNLSKARGFITTAKTEALKMYTPPDLQAQLDLQSGILQVAEGKDLVTAVSYFKEAASASPCRKQRSLALKYLVLGWLLLERPADGRKAAHSAQHLADIDDGVLAMLAVADCAETASVHRFQTGREKHRAHLEGDAVVAPVLDRLYTDMLEKSILNIIRPYSRVQIQHISDHLSLPRAEVERRLSQMVLDGRLSGQLDHRDHCLYLYPDTEPDAVYDAAIQTITHLEKTLGLLGARAKRLL